NIDNEIYRLTINKAGSGSNTCDFDSVHRIDGSRIFFGASLKKENDRDNSQAATQEYRLDFHFSY
ncbi:MAG TPA: hypothetical protein VGQ53_03530, partial [Chitinophagaceae bacterium]|nr:hypothetical protein [Chitinophagaceae bacterium]